MGVAYMLLDSKKFVPVSSCQTSKSKPKASFNWHTLCPIRKLTRSGRSRRTMSASESNGRSHWKPLPQDAQNSAGRQISKIASLYLRLSV